MCAYINLFNNVQGIIWVRSDICSIINFILQDIKKDVVNQFLGFIHIVYPFRLLHSMITSFFHSFF